MSEMKRYWVQAYRKGQHTTWTTEERYNDLAEAVGNADRFALAWDRTMRVIDGYNEKVLHRAGPSTTNTRGRKK